MGWQAVEFDDAAQERINKAATLERELRLSAYFSKHQDLGWCKVRAITPRDCIIFELDENRLFTGSQGSIDDYIHFAYVLRVDLKTQPSKFVKRVARSYRADFKAIEKTQDFISQSFIDCPKHSTNEAVKSVDTGSWLPSLIDCIASEYGWTKDLILDEPIKILFLQMQQIYTRRLGGKYIPSNPITQEARAKEMKKIESHG